MPITPPLAAGLFTGANPLGAAGADGAIDLTGLLAIFGNTNETFQTILSRAAGQSSLGNASSLEALLAPESQNATTDLPAPVSSQLLASLLAAPSFSPARLLTSASPEATSKADITSATSFLPDPLAVLDSFPTTTKFAAPAPRKELRSPIFEPKKTETTTNTVSPLAFIPSTGLPAATTPVVPAQAPIVTVAAPSVAPVPVREPVAISEGRAVSEVPAIGTNSSTPLPEFRFAPEKSSEPSPTFTRSSGPETFSVSQLPTSKAISDVPTVEPSESKLTVTQPTTAPERIEAPTSPKIETTFRATPRQAAPEWAQTPEPKQTVFQSQPVVAPVSQKAVLPEVRQPVLREVVTPQNRLAIPPESVSRSPERIESVAENPERVTIAEVAPSPIEIQSPKAAPLSAPPRRSREPLITETRGQLSANIERSAPAPEVATTPNALPVSPNLPVVGSNLPRFTSPPQVKEPQVGPAGVPITRVETPELLQAPAETNTPIQPSVVTVSPTAPRVPVTPDTASTLVPSEPVPTRITAPAPKTLTNATVSSAPVVTEALPDLVPTVERSTNIAGNLSRFQPIEDTNDQESSEPRVERSQEQPRIHEQVAVHEHSAVVKSESPLRIPEQLAEPILLHARAAETRGESEFHMRLDPPELGSVKVSLTASGDEIRGKVLVASDEIKHLIESQLPELRQRLEAAGVHVGQLDVSVDSGTGQSGGAWRQWLPPETDSQPRLTQAPTRPASTASRSSGSLDITV